MQEISFEPRLYQKEILEAIAAGHRILPARDPRTLQMRERDINLAVHQLAMGERVCVADPSMADEIARRFEALTKKE